MINIYIHIRYRHRCFFNPYYAICIGRQALPQTKTTADNNTWPFIIVGQISRSEMPVMLPGFHTKPPVVNWSSYDFLLPKRQPLANQANNDGCITTTTSAKNASMATAQADGSGFVCWKVQWITHSHSLSHWYSWWKIYCQGEFRISELSNLIGILRYAWRIVDMMWWWGVILKTNKLPYRQA